MASPTPSDSLSTSPLGSLSDHSDLPFPGLDALGPLGSLSSALASSLSAALSSSLSSGLGGSIGGLGSSLGGTGTTTSLGSASGPGSTSSGTSSPGLHTRCGICGETFTLPKVLPCLHTFCQPCLERAQDHPERVTCPVCRSDCPLGNLGVAGLLSDYGISSLIEAVQTEPNPFICTGCKGKDSAAVARCFDCANVLCASCVMAHQYMHCFEGHRVQMLGEIGPRLDKFVICPQHKSERLTMYCRSCCLPVCSECVVAEHNAAGQHELEALTDIGPRLSHAMNQIVAEARQKAADLRSVAQSADSAAGRLASQISKAQTEVNDAFQFYRSILEERKAEIHKELEIVGTARQMALNELSMRSAEYADRLLRTCGFAERLVKYSSPAETLIFKKLLDQKFMAFMSFTPDTQILTGCNDLEFCSNFQSIQTGVRNTFGYIRSGGEPVVLPGRQPPIARPTLAALNHISNGTTSAPLSHLDRAVSASPFDSLARRFSAQPNVNYPASTIGDMAFSAASAYEKWSTDAIFQPTPPEPTFQIANPEPTLDMTSRIITPGMFPPKSQIKRQKMIYHCKFGEFGVMEGQFTEPSGVAVNAQNDIIVADTNNHRIQIFDKEGRFKFQFGECGKRDGQLLYPNRVAVVRPSGDIIVTERSPTHQIQIYNQYGQFVRKFGANILQHPRGVTVDNKGRIIVVECKVMRVIIFDQQGNVLHKFGCSKHLEFPNGVVVNDRQEIFISDNRAHCVKVFSYEGTYLRQIGGEGITNYPIGVCINSNGEILIADNHNNFNLTIFTQEGQLISALESKVKHAQCFDVALMDDGSVVLASKDYRLYVYRYLQVPPIGL